ncbi:type I-F CRISPR-associated protein Csy1 [Pelagibaculum spongiae]|uniref:Type I-F CRISPR-associated protein Csy1 n=1 Tax=Pelagibaculum spongiae TaxID=2080658 RepID=A0A2V1GUL2_9GAMM|nr:type I-F CRISPR-associated protein Csy1 [Pelagibaculum spongiae]PVZ69766.1 type I-F CRISPR-associated protein Csy1 [Pelagibaculum spongiae]
MPDPAIKAFFEERKDAWLKKAIKSSVDDLQQQQKITEGEEKFSFEQWLPDAAKRSMQRAFSTHPSTFSHSATGISESNKKKYTYVTPIIYYSGLSNDGFLRSGNVESSLRLDSLGNAAALDIDSFLSLEMQDGQSLLQHIEQETELAQSLLNIKSKSYAELRDGFLAMTAAATEQVTSSKIKQVFFPIPDDTAAEGYHQLSILTNSGIVFEMRRRLDALRFGLEPEKMSDDDRKKYLTKDELKQARDKRRNKAFFEQSFSEIYGLTTIGYGGTKPQNISVLNNQNGGKAHLLLSVPPNLQQRDFNFPTRDFFQQAVSPYQAKEAFIALHKIFVTHSAESVIPLKNLRSRRDNRLQQITDVIIQAMWQARAVAGEQFSTATSQLPLWQKKWLGVEVSKPEETNDWMDNVLEQISRWIIQGYRKINKDHCTLGDAEIQFIHAFVEQYREALR